MRQAVPSPQLEGLTDEQQRRVMGEHFLRCVRVQVRLDRRAEGFAMALRAQVLAKALPHLRDAVRFAWLARRALRADELADFERLGREAMAALRGARHALQIEALRKRGHSPGGKARHRREATAWDRVAREFIHWDAWPSTYADAGAFVDAMLTLLSHEAQDDGL